MIHTISQDECIHNKITKFGTHLYADGYHQMWRCTTCAKVMKGSRIEKSANPAKKEQTQNHAPVKAGDSNE